MELSNDHLLLHFAANGVFQDGSELLVLEQGEGCHVYDHHGNRYLDGLSSLFCAQIGYSYGREMAEVAGGQMERLAFNTNWGTAHPPALELAERLARLAPEGFGSVFFTSGGSEAVEAAWKLVRQHYVAQGEPQRRKAIARRTSYHGVSLGALALTGVERFKEPFGEPAIPTRHVADTNGFRSDESERERCGRLLEELEAAILAEGPDTVAMVIAEPVQNAGGCIVPPDGYWPGLRKLCDRYGILLVADEVITGFGRLGEWFGVTRYGAVPDVITLAKGLTSAYAAMGAVLVSDRVAAPLYGPGCTLLHGITFGGHPVAAAVALRNIEIFERDGVLDNVRALEPHLRTRLDGLLSSRIVGDVRGAGFFWAIELVNGPDDARFDDAMRDELVHSYLPGRLLEAGLIARADDRGDAVLHLAPPLVADEAVLDEMVHSVETVLEDAATYVGLAPTGVAS